MECEMGPGWDSVSSALLPRQAGMRPEGVVTISRASSASMDMLVAEEKADSREAAE